MKKNETKNNKQRWQQQQHNGNQRSIAQKKKTNLSKQRDGGKESVRATL